MGSLINFVCLFLIELSSIFIAFHFFWSGNTHAMCAFGLLAVYIGERSSKVFDRIKDKTWSQLLKGQ